jgi:cation:H+ antiporter
MAAWSGEPGLALGNAIGSIIADTGLIFGVGCLITRLPADRFVLNRQGWVQFGSGLLLSGLAYGAWAVSGDQAALGRWVGFLMVALLAVYLWFSVGWSTSHSRLEAASNGNETDAEDESGAWWKLAVLALSGLALVLLGSRALILSVTILAEVHWHVPQVVIAATLVALGTSTPELVIGMASIIKGQKEILVGNVIGADILNVLFVVGASAVAAPLPLLDPGARLPQILFLVHLPTMLLILLLFRIFIFRAASTGHFRRWQGIPLLGIYVIYTVVQYFVS